MKILLGITGGIAAYKSLELTRILVKAGHEVQVVMTYGAKRFIQPLSFQALSGHPVRDCLFDTHQEAGMGHIELARWPDQIIIAPASAEVLAKLRIGRADDLLTTLCLASDRPIMLAPTMNRLMWTNQATQENVQILKQRGFILLEPTEGEQACGEVGMGRMSEPLTIVEAILSFHKHKQVTDQAWLSLKRFWNGKPVLISAGPTFESIDPVRFIGNRSSGKMGFTIAEIAQKLGAKVTLIAGAVNLPTPVGVSRVDVRTAEEMFVAVKKEYAKVDYFISVAAVADFKVAEPAEDKLKKQAGEDKMVLNLVKTPDIIAWVAQQTDKPYVVGFAAETQNIVAYAKDKLQSKNLDMICANQVGANLGFEQAINTLTLITKKHEQVLQLSAKSVQAVGLLGFIAEQCKQPAKHFV